MAGPLRQNKMRSNVSSNISRRSVSPKQLFSQQPDSMGANAGHCQAASINGAGRRQCVKRDRRCPGFWKQALRVMGDSSLYGLWINAQRRSTGESSQQSAGALTSLGQTRLVLMHHFAPVSTPIPRLSSPARTPTVINMSSHLHLSARVSTFLSADSTCNQRCCRRHADSAEQRA